MTNLVERDTLGKSLFLGISLILLLSPVALKLDFQRPCPIVPDIVCMLPNFISWLLAFETILVLYTVVTYPKAIHYVVISTVIIFLIFPYVQWPVVMSGVSTDAYLHAQMSEVLASGLELSYIVSLDHPGVYLLHNIFSEIAGVSLLTSSLALTFIFQVISLLMVFILGRMVKGASSGYAALSIFTLGAFRFWMYSHFSPQMFALCLYPLILWCVLGLPKSQSRLIVIFLTFSTLVISHSLTSVLLILTLLPLLLLSQKITKNMLLIYLLMLLSWTIYGVSTGLLRERVIPLLTTLVLPSFELLAEYIFKGGRRVGNPALSLYQLGIYSWIGLGVFKEIFSLRGRPRNPLSASFVGVTLWAIFLFVISDFPRQTFLDRVILVGIIPSSILALASYKSLYKSLSRHLHGFLGGKTLMLVYLLLFPISFVTSYSYSGLSAITTQEVSPGLFLAQYQDDPQLPVSTDFLSFIVYQYFDTDIKYYLGFGFLDFNDEYFGMDYLNQISRPSLTIISSKFKKMCYYLQGIPFAKWKDFERRLGNKSNLIYSNQYTSIYTTRARE